MLVRGVGDAITDLPTWIDQNTANLAVTLNEPANNPLSFSGQSTLTPAQLAQQSAANAAYFGGASGGDFLSQLKDWISSNPIPTALGSAAIFLLAFAGGNARR